jgi:uncharacterized protein YbjT (DUF2867 family)
MLDSGYFRAKLAQEKLIESSSIPYTIVRATQFFEFVPRIADAATDGTVVRVPPVSFQPIAGDDLAKAVGRTAVGAPVNGTVEVAGPDRYRMDEFFRTALAAGDDGREVVTDATARYFGINPSESTLVPDGNAVLGKTHYRDWAARP